MYFKQFYLQCLAHSSYLIGSEGQAIVVDPQRDVDQYIQEAEANGLKIVSILETHLHADFVSGHRELAERTGAEIIFGWRANAAFPHRAVRDGDRFAIGSVEFKILETPGHTPEGICALLHDRREDEPAKLLTGDTLFIGDVGRPDLAGSVGFTAEQMAATLYDSLHNKILPLPDETGVYPAHGAGSMCGRSISEETYSTLGAQRKTNYALQPMAKEDFVAMMTTDLPEAPAYFSTDAEINRSGAPALQSASRPAAMSASEVRELAAQGATILDVRTGAEFGNGHVPGSINIGLTGQFASWAGSLLDFTKPVVLIAEDESNVEEAVMRLGRVGIETVRGYLAGGMYAWDKAGMESVQTPQMPVGELDQQLSNGAVQQLIDVRRPAEYTADHFAVSRSIPLSGLSRHLDGLRKDVPTAVICQSGYRSSAAAGLLQREGFSQVFNVVGGMAGYKALHAAKQAQQ